MKWFLFLFGLALIGELIYILFLYYQKTHYSIINDYTQEYLDMEQAHFQELQEKDKNIRKFRHDMQAHLAAINGYLESNDSEKLTQYLHSLTDAFATTHSAFQTGSTITDSILNQKSALLTEEHICLTVKNDLSPLNSIDDFSICTIISNSVQNAIEACIRIPQKERRWIDINLSSIDDCYVLEISNSVKEKVTIKHNKIPTSKADGSNHGFGLVQIAQIAENLKSDFYLECKEMVFRLRIRMKVS